MQEKQAEVAVKFHRLVGTANVYGLGAIRLFSTGFLIKKIGSNFLFQDRWREVTVIRSASEFIFS